MLTHEQTPQLQVSVRKYQLSCGLSLVVMLTSVFSFLPSIVASLGYQGSIAQLMTVPPFVVSAARAQALFTYVSHDLISFFSAVAIITGYIADRHAARGLTMIVSGTTATIGFTMFLGKSPCCTTAL